MLVRQLMRDGMQSWRSHLEELMRRLDSQPDLVVVTGPPGAGKTRAIQVAVSQVIERDIALPVTPVKWRAAVPADTPSPRPALDVDVVGECIVAGFVVALVLWIGWPAVTGQHPPEVLDRLLQGALIALPFAYQQRGQ